MTTTLLFPEMAPDPTFDFPHTLAEKYRPRLISDFAGLRSNPTATVDGPKDALTDFVARPCNRGFLFVGPAGTGKTSMGMALATELQAFMHHIPAGLCTVDALAREIHSCHYCPPPGFKRHLILIDEADLMSQAAQDKCLSKLDGTDTVPDTVWVFTANATDRLHPRFLSRNKVLNFTNYAMQSDESALLERVWLSEMGPDAPRPNFAAISKASLGNVRHGLELLDGKISATRRMIAA